MADTQEITVRTDMLEVEGPETVKTKETTKSPFPEFRDINIVWSGNGYIIRVGCQSFVLEGTIERLLENLKIYLTDPETTTKEFWNKTFKLV